MVALSPSLLNESYIEPSRYDWLRSRAPVPTTYAPACKPLAEFAEVLENRTSRALGITTSCTESQVVNPEIASNYVVVWLELRWIEHNGEAFDSRVGQMYLRARWYDLHRFTTLDPYVGNSSDPLSFNKFGFVHGNTVMGIDPTGWEFSLVGLVVSVGIQNSLANIKNEVDMNILNSFMDLGSGRFDGKSGEEVLLGLLMDQTGAQFLAGNLSDIVGVLTKMYLASDGDEIDTQIPLMTPEETVRHLIAEYPDQYSGDSATSSSQSAAAMVGRPSIKASSTLKWRGPMGWWTNNRSKFTKQRVAGRPIWVTNGKSFWDVNAVAKDVIDEGALTAMRDGKKKQMILTGKTNRDLMQEGYAPIGKDGFEMNLHHSRQREPGTMMELPGSTHRKYHKILHPKTVDSWRIVKANVDSYEKFFDSYWKWRANT